MAAVRPVMRSAPAMSPAVAAVNAVGQNLGEMFELYGPPAVVDAAQPQGFELCSLGVRKARGEVHRDGDWHRAVQVWLWMADDTSQLLLQQRSELKDTHPGMWDVSCAGHITAGDGSLDTAEKELQEELGLAVEPGALKAALLCTFAASVRGSTKRYGEFRDNELMDVYLLRCPGDALRPEALNPGAGEVAAVKLMPAADVLRAWETDNAAYVPRTPSYCAMMRAALGI